MKQMKIFITLIILTGLLPISAHAWPIPDSGQTKCYNDTAEIPCPAPGEDFYGQDGNYLINPPSYTKLDASGNDLPDDAASWVMVRDNVTGLIWEVKQNKDDVPNYANPHDADNTYTWYDSNSKSNGGDAGTPGNGTDTEDYVAQLNAAKFGGYSDWRLPTVKELTSITDMGRDQPAIAIGYFPNTQSLGYWSSTACINNTVDAWYVYFHYGYDYTYSKSYGRYVRAVRGKQSDSDFIINNDGTITDIRNGLMWQQNTGGSMTWKDSLSYCESLTLAEYSDWRLPNREELRSLTDYGKYDPAIDSSVFPDTSSSFYWTSSSYDRYRDCSWDMDFYSGYDGSNGKDSSKYVRAVRSGQARLLGHLVISSPAQAAFWDAGDTMPVKWETQNIGGNVKITLSRDGGKTFETITESTPNDGSYDWTVSGSPSVNCMLKIEPLNDPDKWTQQSLFTIASNHGPVVSDVVVNPDIILEGSTPVVLTATVTAPDSHSIIAGAEYSIGVTATAPGAGLSMVPEDGTFDATSEAVTATVDTSALITGNYNLWVRGQDDLGNWGDAVSATLNVNGYDTTPPTAPTFKSSSPSVSTWTDDNTITVVWNPGQDSQSGVAGYSCFFDTAASTVPDSSVETAATQITGPALADGNNHFFHIRTVDNAGNVSDTLHIGPFKIDTTPPTGNISINSGAASTDSQNVTLSLSAADSGSGLSQMQFSNDNMNWSSPENYSTSAVWALTSGEGSKTVYARFSDTLGNLSEGTISDEITYAPSAAYPPDPTGLVIEKKDDSQISLKWNQISTPSGVTYAVFRSRSENGIFYKVNTDDIDASDAFQGKVYYTDRHLENGTTYYYKIQSFLSGTGSQHYSAIVSASPQGPKDYEIHIVEADRIVNIYGSIIYNIQIIPKENFSGSLLLTCPASDGLTPLFSLNGTESGTSLNNLVPPASVSLKITAGSLAQTGVHLLTLRAMNTVSGELRETFLHLTVVSNSGSGMYANVEKEVISKGEKTVIYGGLFPNIPDRPVILTLDKEGDTAFPKSKNLHTDQYGKFRETEWIATLGIGEYSLQASWTDDMAQKIQSQIIPFTVEKGLSHLTCLRKSSAEPEIGTDFSVNGNLSPALSWPIISLRMTDPDGQFSDISVQQSVSAFWESTRNFFNRRGIWKFRAYWPGNADYTGCESDELIIPVGTDAGRVIILGGGLADQQNTYWQSTVRFCTDVYRNFRRKGFTDDMIHLLINSDMIDINWNGQADDGVTDSNPPTAAAFLEVIENEFSAELNEETPLYIYMQGHGTSDGRFKVLGDDEFVTAPQIAQALDSIQSRTGCKVILILESCYSGNFIPELSGENRVIVTSAGGEPYNTDASGNISFSAFLFSKLMEGNHFKKAFDAAGDNLTAVNYPAPALDDNDDKKYDFNDGLLAANTWLTGNLSWGLKPVIMEAEAAQVLEGASELPIRVKITAGDTQTQRVWAQIIAPDADITGGTTTIAYPESQLLLNPASGLYEGTLGGLYRAGLWKIVIHAEESDHDVSDPFVIWVSASGMPGPGDISGDGKVDLADAVKGLRILCGAETPAADITHADADGDGDVGLEEIIFILREVSGQ